MTSVRPSTSGLCSDLGGLTSASAATARRSTWKSTLWSRNVGFRIGLPSSDRRDLGNNPSNSAGVCTITSNDLAFTLIEVLLALALFAISVVVLASSYVNVLFGLEAVRVDRVLEQEMAFVRTAILTAPDLETIEEGGELPTAELGYAYWEAELEPTDVADLFIVHVTISLEGTARGEERTLNNRLIVLRPSWSEPLEREELRAASKERLAEIKLNRPL